MYEPSVWTNEQNYRHKNTYRTIRPLSINIYAYIPLYRKGFGSERITINKKSLAFWLFVDNTLSLNEL